MQMHDILHAHQVERQVERRQSRKRERPQSIGCRSRLPASQAYMFCVQAPTGVAEARIQSTGSVCCRYTSLTIQSLPRSHWPRRPSTGARPMLSGGSRSLKLVVEERMIPLHFPRPGSPPIVSVLVLARDTPPNLRPSPWSAPDW